jgi:regulator of sirC expression with transglutaminase-like and TPR domain
VTSPRAELARIAGLPDAEIDLAEAALWIAAEEHAGVDVRACLRRLDALAEALARDWPARGGLADRVARLNRHLFAEHGFRGNQRDYYDPRNSFLDQVIERRLGIPITLAIVYMAVARRLGLDARGISFPGHFLVKCVDPREGELVVDAFAGSVVSLAECQRRLDAAAGRHLRLDPAVHLRAATPREILVRVLGNLKQIFHAKGDLAGALACCDRILLLTPDEPMAQRERDALRARVRVH